VSLVARGVVLAAALGWLAPGAHATSPAARPDSGPVRIEVDALTDAPGRCEPGSAGDCTLRAALQSPRPAGEQLVVQLPSGVLLQTSFAPFEVAGSVEVRGAPEGTVIVSSGAHRVFSLAPGSTLRLSGLQVEGGDPSVRTGIGPARLELRDVRVGALPGATAEPDDPGAFCGPSAEALTALPVARADVTDPLGARSLPGGLA